MKFRPLKLFYAVVLLTALSSCIQVPPQDPASYQAALNDVSDEDFRNRDRERRSAAAAYRESGQQAPDYHYHQHSNNFIGW